MSEHQPSASADAAAATHHHDAERARLEALLQNRPEEKELRVRAMSGGKGKEIRFGATDI